MNKKNNYTLLIIIIIILISILGIIFFSDTEKKEQEIVKESNIKLLDDYSRFYTLDSCVYKYIAYITSNKQDEILNILDEEYIESNNITKDTLYNYINKLEGMYSFKSKKIYYETLSTNFFKYYIYGKLQKEGINGIIDSKDYYLIIKLDLKNNLFSVTPYNGKIFKEAK